jgi:hypothetical protein
VNSAHDERRAAEIMSIHCRVRQGRHVVCAACGQSWPCTDYAWATYEPAEPWTGRDVARVALAAIVVGIVVPVFTARLLPTWAWWLVLALEPLLLVGVIIAASRRRP